MKYPLQRRYYRCRARELGYECPQKGVRVEGIDSQVVTVLMNLKPPKNWRKNITSTMSQILGEKDLAQSIKEIQAKIKRMDMRWDNGFITSETEYMKKRIELQHELEQLTPVGDDELEKTADLLENFAEHWERLEGDEEGRHELVKLIVDRVYVEDETVVAITLKSNYHLVLGHNAKEPTSHEVDPYLVQVRERRAWRHLWAQMFCMGYSKRIELFADPHAACLYLSKESIRLFHCIN